MSGVFITATGTEIGKTFVTASLCHQLRQARRDVHAIKPLISGINEQDMSGTDTAIIAEALGLSLTQAHLNAISPCRYKAPLAPAMAAKLEGKQLEYQALLSFCKDAMARHDICLIEGVGGSFVPLTETKLVADWIKDLELPSIVVAGSYLGTLSHITATLEAMAARNLPVLALVICESAGDNHPDFDETIQQARNWANIPVIKQPRLEGPCVWQHSHNLLPLLETL